MVLTTEEAISKYLHLKEENKHLKRWKREALIALSDWDKVWEAAGRPGKLGSLKAKAVLAEIERLKAKEH